MNEVGLQFEGREHSGKRYVIVSLVLIMIYNDMTSFVKGLSTLNSE